MELSAPPPPPRRRRHPPPPRRRRHPPPPRRRLRRRHPLPPPRTPASPSKAVEYASSSRWRMVQPERTYHLQRRATSRVWGAAYAGRLGQ
jgi:hypothetical protein